MANDLGEREIALTGRLAALTRDEAIDKIAANGGRHVNQPTRSTDWLVVGQEGWPLKADGRLTQALETAQRLQAEGIQIEIVSEGEFLAAIGMTERQADLRRLFTLEQLAKILDLPTARIRAWVRQGLIRPAKVEHRLCSFDFQEVASAKALQRLLQAGAAVGEIRRSLDRLKTSLPETAAGLTHLELTSHGNQLVVRTDHGALVEPSGQLQFDFEPVLETEQLRSLRREMFHRESRTLQEWFEAGVAAEDSEDLERAAHAYQQAMLAGGPKASIAFNLGNVLHGLGRSPEATQRYMQAVEMAPDYVEAWNNLGIVLCELDRATEAVRAFERAILVAPTYADARFNLAETFESLRRSGDAEEHWKAYLRSDPHSSEAEHARRRMAEHRASQSN